MDPTRQAAKRDDLRNYFVAVFAASVCV